MGRRRDRVTDGTGAVPRSPDGVDHLADSGTIAKARRIIYLAEKAVKRGSVNVRLDPGPVAELAERCITLETAYQALQNETDTTGVFDAMADAVMALLADQDHRVLAEATTEASNELWYAADGKSYLPEQLLDTPPGTVVAVVSRDNQNATEADDG